MKEIRTKSAAVIERQLSADDNAIVGGGYVQTSLTDFLGDQDSRTSVAPGVSTALQNTLYSMVIASEVSSNSATANMLSQVGGHWSFGWIQDDFHTGQGPANSLLTQALQGGGYSTSAQNAIVAALDSNYGTNSVASIDQMLAGIIGPGGGPVTINSINSIFHTSVTAGDAIASVSESQFDSKTFSQTNTSSLLYRLDNAATVGNTGALNADLAAALANPSEQAAILAPLADYNNQFGLDTNKQMWQLLTQGSAVFGGGDAPSVTVTLNTSSLSTMMQSILAGEFNTTYSYDNSESSCQRIAEQVNNTNEYLAANGDPLVAASFTLQNGTSGDTGVCKINTSLSGSTTTTNWSETDPDGSASGRAVDNGASSTWAYGTNINNTANDTSISDQYNSSGPISQSDTTYSGLNGSGTITSVVDWLAETPSGFIDSVTLNGATVDVPNLTVAALSGTTNAVQLSYADSLNVFGSNNTLSDIQGDVTVNLASGLTDSFAGTSGDIVSLAGSDNLTSTLGSVEINLNGNNDNVVGVGDTVLISSTSNSDVLGGYGDTVSVAGSESLTLESGSSSGTTYGVGDNINLGNGDTFTNNTGAYNGYLPDVNVSLSAGDTDTFNGNTHEGVSLANNDTVTGSGELDFFKGGYDDLLGSSNTVVESGNGTISGSGDTFDNFFGSSTYTGLTDSLIGNNNTFTQSSSDTLFLNGTGDTVGGVSGDVLSLLGSSSATVTTTGDAINFDGASDTVTGSYDSFSDFSNSDNIIGNYDSVVMSGGTQATAQGINVTGSDDRISEYNYDNAFLAGQNDTLSGASGDGLIFGANSSATIINGGENVAFWGASDTVTGSGDNFSWSTLGGELNNVNEFVTGNNDTFAEGGTGDNLGLTGTRNIVTGVNGDGLIFGANSSATVDNTGENVSFWGGNDTVTGSGDSFNWNTLGGPLTGVNETANGSNDTFAEAGSDNLLLSGVNDVLNGTSGSGLIFDGAGSSATVNNAGESVSFWSGNDTVTGSSDSFSWNTLGGPLTGVNETANGNSDTFAEAGSDNLLLSGVNDILNGTSGSGLIFDGNGSSATVNNNGENVSFWSGNDTVNGSGDNFSWNTLGGPLTGVSEAVTGSSDTLNVAASDHLNLTGGSDTFGLTSGDIATVGGSSSQLGTDTGTGVAGDQVTFNDLTNNNSQLQLLDPNASSYFEYTDYKGLNDIGNPVDQTFDNNNNTSQTTWYDPSGYADVIQATEKFTGVDDSGDLSSLNFNTTTNETYSDSFIYSGNTIEDVWQEVTNSTTNKEIADDEFNSQGQLVDAVYGYAQGYVPDLGYAYSYAKVGPGTVGVGEFGLRHAMGRSVFQSGGNGHDARQGSEAASQAAAATTPTQATVTSLPELVHAIAAFGQAGAHVTTALPPPYAVEMHFGLAAAHL